MRTLSVFAQRRLRVLGTVAALLMGSTLAGQRAEALSPINPGMSRAGKTVANERTIEVRGGGHGGGGGGHGFGSGGFGGGGRSFVGGGGFGGGGGRGFVANGARVGSFSAAPAISAGGARVGQFAGGPHFIGHGYGFHHGFRHRHGFFVGGVYYDDYPYNYPDYYDYPDYSPVYSVPVPVYVGGGGCHRVMTVHGPRVTCHHRAARHYRIHRRRHHRSHHRA